ncbi:hypothetical protein [Nocardia nova]|uniref:hypothetical protein n=1 Tax=Nocardia nova TaxID=37330 RepID=UPI0033E629D2
MAEPAVAAASSVEQVMDVLRPPGDENHLSPDPYSQRPLFVGDGVLTCGVCGARCYGAEPARAAGVGPLRGATYSCSAVGCRNQVFVEVADQLLQDFTRERLRGPEATVRWQAFRLHELDFAIARGLTVRAWCAEPMQRKLVRNALHWREWQLDRAVNRDLAGRVENLIRERVELAGYVERANGRELEEISAARANYGALTGGRARFLAGCGYRGRGGDTGATSRQRRLGCGSR